MRARDVVQIASEAPKVDYTFDNKSDHYALVDNGRVFETGSVGYFHMQNKLNITFEESYCLKFQYYNYGHALSTNLVVYIKLSNQSTIIQRLWPDDSSGQYK